MQWTIKAELVNLCLNYSLKQLFFGCKEMLLLLYHYLCLLDLTFDFEILVIQNQGKIHNNLR